MSETLTGLQSAILGAIVSEPGQWNRTELAHDLDRSPAEIRDACQALFDRGLVHRKGRRRAYHPQPDGVKLIKGAIGQAPTSARQRADAPPAPATVTGQGVALKVTFAHLVVLEVLDAQGPQLHRELLLQLQAAGRCRAAGGQLLYHWLGCLTRAHAVRKGVRAPAARQRPGPGGPGHLWEITPRGRALLQAFGRRPIADAPADEATAAQSSPVGTTQRSTAELVSLPRPAPPPDAHLQTYLEAAHRVRLHHAAEHAAAEARLAFLEAQQGGDHG